mgnify:FL=1
MEANITVGLIAFVPFLVEVAALMLDAVAV